MSEKYGPWIAGPPPEAWDGKEVHRMLHRIRIVGDEIMAECLIFINSITASRMCPGCVGKKVVADPDPSSNELEQMRCPTCLGEGEVYDGVEGR